jgi:hypothetical protein
MLPIVFYTSPKEHRLEMAETFAAGVRRHGDNITFQPLGQGFPDCYHAAVIIGNKQRYLLNPLSEYGCPIISIDRAYAVLEGGELSRIRNYSRVSINDSHPMDFLGKLSMPDDRRNRFNWNPKPWRREGKYIVFAGAARSYYDRRGIPGIRSHVIQVVDDIKRYSKRQVLFRVKPNLRRDFGGPLPNAIDASHKVYDLPALFADCHTLVVEESSIAIEALLSGVPSVVLGPSPTRLISSTCLSEVDNPKLASHEEVTNLLNDLAYFQFNSVEYGDGTAWAFLRGLLPCD